jgi:hypothetical protein
VKQPQVDKFYPFFLFYHEKRSVVKAAFLKCRRAARRMGFTDKLIVTRIPDIDFERTEFQILQNTKRVKTLRRLSRRFLKIISTPA